MMYYLLNLILIKQIFATNSRPIIFIIFVLIHRSAVCLHDLAKVSFEAVETIYDSFIIGIIVREFYFQLLSVETEFFSICEWTLHGNILYGHSIRTYYKYL